MKEEKKKGSVYVIAVRAKHELGTVAVWRLRQKNYCELVKASLIYLDSQALEKGG